MVAPVPVKLPLGADLDEAGSGLVVKCVRSMFSLVWTVNTCGPAVW